MRRQLVSRFRDEIDRSDIVGVAIVTGIFALFGFEATAVAVAFAFVVGVPVIRSTVDAMGIDIKPGVAGLLFGSFAVVAGAVQFTDGHSWLGWGLVAIGGWICLDGLDRWYHGDTTEATRSDGIDGWRITDSDTPTDESAAEVTDSADVSTSELALMGEHNRWLIEELHTADRPLTQAEIESRTGLSGDEFEALLETHGESGPIERVGNGYTVDEDELGVAAMGRALVRTIGGRLVRPFRLLRLFRLFRSAE